MATDHDGEDDIVLNYSKGIDFKALAAFDPAFARLLTANRGKVNFSDPDHLRQLTRTTLKKDFDVDIELPEDRLCPPVPVRSDTNSTPLCQSVLGRNLIVIRYNYIRFLQQLLDTTSITYSDVYEPQRIVRGLDIGTGASAIYPLLACATRPNWHMIATEIDDSSVLSAQSNVARNPRLAARIQPVLTTNKDRLIPLDKLGVQTLDFVMCNPPFYESEAEMEASMVGATKAQRPSAVCTGAVIEMVTPGGDAEFVRCMLHESTVLKNRVKWYSSMFGKLSSVIAIVKEFKPLGIDNWAVASLRAGQRTNRWVIAWSWGRYRPINTVARASTRIKEILPFPTEVTVPFNGEKCATIAARVNVKLQDLALLWQWNQEKLEGLVIMQNHIWKQLGDVWKRYGRRHQYQRAKEIAETNGDKEHGEDVKNEQGENADEIFVVRITLRASTVHVRWLNGSHHTTWEGFNGMLKRTIAQKPADEP